MKTIKDLKDGDIIWFVEDTDIKETIVKNFHIKESPVIDDLEIYKPHYWFETWLDGKLQFKWNFELEEYKDETDTALFYDGKKDYSYFCSFLNKNDALKMLRKNIGFSIRTKQKMIERINKEIKTLKKKQTGQELDL